MSQGDGFAGEQVRWRWRRKNGHPEQVPRGKNILRCVLALLGLTQDEQGTRHASKDDFNYLTSALLTITVFYCSA